MTTPEMLICWLATCLTLFAAPELTVAQERIDLGPLSPEQQTAVATFHLSNSGDALLRVQDVRLTCGCLAYDLAADQVAPGEATELAVTLSVPEAGYGLVVKHVYVTTNSEPAMRRLTLMGKLPDRPRVQPAPSPEREPPPTGEQVSEVVTIDAAQLGHLIGSIRDVTDLRILDTRPREAFAAGSVDHAISFPPGDWRHGPTAWPARSVLVVIAQSEASSRTQAHLFASWGYRIVMRLEGGYPALEGSP